MDVMFTEKRTAEQIVQEAVDNNCVIEVYEILHNIMMDNINYLKDKSRILSAERKLVKKFANEDKLDVIKTILEDEEY